MRKRIALIALIILILTACGPDQTGNGHEFVITGQVTDVGEESIEIVLERTESANGEAQGWMDDPGNKHRIHDNCDCHGFWSGRKQYGFVFHAGEMIDLTSLQEGWCVRISGAIRRDQDGKTSHLRPVYESAIVVSCETWD